ncbi:helix-turn-helix domain-containing protein (plasmid) [Streptomyces sp. NBC_00053]|uniref:AraC-like ligand-binding domain-containing protein n=1 Tax=unclassified Streptomyces TaxID=2593676 RepID=UPI0022593F69|nr:MULTISPECIES: helix-turn-helix domain-containing protein [unclassified Streptomyces]MCX4399922.1 helix-turn-helix domain-containing protein [Streptomyces sp. NBC_01767]MCX5506073.1 helix-turn-helix domain-containing protein [Streptomyces sp. NBC_00052]MCX5554271.1 helix-turn-helix domain-containing protein [Streptomyces sp. NBC_00051]WSP52977.1 helix-turn-helix domain-containing protein [Streptomyces sp. NBC_01243]
METVFNSDELPVDRRMEGWAETTALAMVTTQMRFLDPNHLTARLRVSSLGDMQLSALSYSSLVSRRTPTLVRRSDPELFQLALVNRGRQHLEQAGRSVALNGGQMVLYDSSLPFEAGVEAGLPAADSLVLQFPKKLLPLRCNQITRLLAVPLSARSGIGRLLARFLTDLSEDDANYTLQDRARLQATVVDLVSTVLAHHLDEGRMAPPHSQQRILFLRVSSYVQEHLGCENLTPASIAAAHQVSLRTLHRLFESNGTTVGSFIRQQRLERVRRDLAAAHLSHLPAHALGARWGYSDPAAFTRAFRNAYGAPPGKYRRLCLQGIVGTRR